MTQKAQIVSLETQAAHFHGLAKDIALELLQRPDHPDAAKKKHTAQMHLIRAESFRTSIKLITGQLEPTLKGAH
ncbi:MAG: hypothetical protein NTZ16_12560 [Verrucomicrobia bacterium]|nr:hypothetical protein [Verrucomicrobiota bacterium]